MGAFFIAYIVFGRSKQKPPTKLNMRAINNSDNASAENVNLQSHLNQKSTQRYIPEPKQSLLEAEAPFSNQNVNLKSQGAKPTKQLSIFFMYNGHDWEAHEVLGIPQGASVDIATKAYQDQLKTSQPSSYEFLESAYSAIFKKRRNEKL